MARTLDIAGFNVRDTTAEVLVRHLAGCVRQPRRATVLFANAHFVVQCRDQRGSIAARRDVIVLPDGVGIDLAAKLVHGRAFRENLNGTDFVPRCLAGLGRGTSVFLLGAAPGVAREAGRRLAETTGVTLAGHADDYSLWTGQDEVVGRVNAARPDVLLVALGNPLQERWILENRARLDATLVFGVGGLFDFVTRHRAPGTGDRAPRAAGVGLPPRPGAAPARPALHRRPAHFRGHHGRGAAAN